MALTRDQIVTALKSNVVNVTYTKVSGEEATIRATLQEGKLLPTKGTGNTENLDTISVVDLDKNAWRSFRVANVKSIETI